MEKHFASGGVVVKEDRGDVKVLLIKDGYGHWTWPKGHMEEGETPEDTALREISEETGLKTLKVLEEIGKQEYWYTFESVRIFKTVHIFLVKAKPGEDLKIQKEEISEGEWVKPEEALVRIEYEGSKEILKKAINLFCEKYL